MKMRMTFDLDHEQFDLIREALKEAKYAQQDAGQYEKVDEITGIIQMLEGAYDDARFDDRTCATGK